MILRTKEHYLYYLHITFSLFLSLCSVLLLQYAYGCYMFNRSIFSWGYVVHTYRIFERLMYYVPTFWFDILTLVVFISIFGYLQRKNKYKRVVEYSRFATWRDIRTMSPSVLKEDGFTLGSYSNMGKSVTLRSNEPLGLLCVAPAGAGKTSGTVVPCILSADKDSLIINDPKGELYDLTHKYRRSLGGEVYRIEWGQLKDEQNKFTTKWNPLALSNMPKDTAQRAKFVDMIVNILIKTSSGDSFWSNSGRKTLSAVMLLLIYEKELEGLDTNIGQCKDLLATVGVLNPNIMIEKDPIQYGFDQLRIATEGLSIPEVIKKRCATVFAELSSASPNVLGGILATVAADLSVFNNENVIDMTSSNTFSMAKIRGEIEKNGKEKKYKPVTVYLISPAAEQELFGVLSAIFVEAAYKFITSQDLATVKNSNMVRFILDEVAFFPKISAIVDGPAIARGYRGSFLFVCQDLGQIREKYGDNGVNTMMTNTAFKIILPQNNDETAKRFANLGGTTEIKEWESDGKGKRVRRKKYKPLLETSDILHLPEGKQIVFTQNNARTPILCDIPFYFKDTKIVKKLKKAND